MSYALTISQAQLAQLARAPHDAQRQQLQLEMAAFWLLYEADWQPQFRYVPTYEERQAFFGEVCDWAWQIGLSEHAHLLTAATLLLRATCQGWPAENQALARGFIEADPDNPEPALRWLQAAFDQ
jgi:hypothetical protein